MPQINKESANHDIKLEQVLKSLLTDITAVKSAVDTMATKLNADAGVTDTNYAAAAALTTTSE